MLIILPNNSVLLVCGYGYHKMPRSLFALTVHRDIQPPPSHLLPPLAASGRSVSIQTTGRRGWQLRN
ncbi:hypothetical protein LSAT2_002923 [Lamellibrachia satsuma]|nr:hypothetical protein LSAT2_002923 [Lamellibrachia satsuma]